MPLKEFPMFSWLFGSKKKSARSSASRCRRSLAVEALEGRVLLSGTWSALAHTAPGGVGTMLLLSDGTVMAQNGGNAGWYRLTPLNGDYGNGTWTQLASMHDPRL